MPKGKKSKESKKETVEVEAVEEVENDHEKWDEGNTSSESEHESRPQRPGRQSVADFDHDEIQKFDEEKLADVPTEKLIKVLIVRGKRNLNPSLQYGATNLYKRLNGERVPRRNRPRLGGGRPRRDEDSRPFQRRY